LYPTNGSHLAIIHAHNTRTTEAENMSSPRLQYAQRCRRVECRPFALPRVVLATFNTFNPWSRCPSKYTSAARWRAPRALTPLRRCMAAQQRNGSASFAAFSADPSPPRLHSTSKAQAAPHFLPRANVSSPPVPSPSSPANDARLYTLATCALDMSPPTVPEEPLPRKVVTPRASASCASVK